LGELSVVITQHLNKRPEGPTPHRRVDLRLSDGALCHLRQHGNLSAPVRLFLSHGNGFAIDAYLPFWQPLLDAFEVVVFDQRNHGWNAPSDPAHHTYEQLVQDLETICRDVTAHLGSKPSVGVFHSMSARTAMKHAVEVGWRWAALVLFDPPTLPPAHHPLYERAMRAEDRLVSWALNRRQRFATPQELAAVFKALRAHQHWVKGAHEGMAQAVLRRDHNAGDWVLICPGALEATIYRGNRRLNLWPHAHDYGGPVKLMASDPTVPHPGAPALANRLLAETQGYDYTAIAGAGHMLQLEQPHACRRAMLSFLAHCGLIPAPKTASNTD
jgi:pimeloyl-ACP methyl ester carboxylesterase